MMRPSYYDGFYPRDGSPLHPNLQVDLFGGWVPGLGNVGNRLLDIKSKNDGVFDSTSLPVWGASGLSPDGGPVLKWTSDLVASSVDLGDILDFRFLREETWSVTVSFAITQLTDDDRSLIRKREAFNTRVFLLRADNTDPANLELYLGSDLTIDSTGTIDANQWVTVFVTNDGTQSATSLTLAIHTKTGALISRDVAQNTSEESTPTEEIRLFGSEGSDEFRGHGGPVYFYKKVLSHAEQSLIARDNLAPVRMTPFFVGKAPAAGGGDPEASLLGGKLIRGGLLGRRLVAS